MSDVVTTDSRVRILPPPEPDGVVAITRRVSELGFGAASLTTRAVVDAVDRFRPGGAASGREHEPSVVRDLGRAATGMAIAAEQRMLDIAETVELGAQRAVELGTRVPGVRDALVGLASFIGRWSDRAEVEQARRRTEATELVQRLVPAVMDAALERLDVRAVVARVPLAEIVAALDVDALLDQIDLDAILAHVDANALMERIDVASVVARVDPEAIVSRVDVNALMERVDVESVVSRVDANALVARVDAQALIDRVDANALLARIDLDALFQRVDLPGIVAEVLDEIDVGAIVRESTGSITNDAVDGARLTAMRLDGFVARVADRVLLRGTHDRSGVPDEPEAVG